MFFVYILLLCFNFLLGVVLRFFFGCNIKVLRYGFFGKGFGFGINDIKFVGLEEYSRINIDKLLNKMG